MIETMLMFWPQVTDKHDVQYKKDTVNLYKGQLPKDHAANINQEAQKSNLQHVV